jgi:DnaJ family protein B protein 12
MIWKYSLTFDINFYDVMGLNKSCTLQEIRKAYNFLSKKYHPDKTDDPTEVALFELVQRAYECLSNETKRKEYDFYINNVEKISCYIFC